MLRRVARHRNYDEAVTERCCAPSPIASTPRCPHFGICGGCALQHLAPDAQLAFKQSQLLENLARLGDVDAATRARAARAVRSGTTAAARGSASSTCRARARCWSGFASARRRTSRTCASATCSRAPVGGLLEPLGRLVDGLSIATRVPQIEVAVATTRYGSRAARARSHRAPPTVDDWRHSSGTTRVRSTCSRAVRRPIAPLDGWRSRRSLYTLAGPASVTIEFEPTDFVQINGALNQAMVERALDVLAPQPTDAVLDLFCGLGNFSLPLARRSRRVVGRGGRRGLVAAGARQCRAQRHRQRRVPSRRPVQGRVQGVPWARGRYDLVLLDPPRAGAREVLPIVAAQRRAPRRVYFLSSGQPRARCRPAGA